MAEAHGVKGGAVVPYISLGMGYRRNSTRFDNPEAFVVPFSGRHLYTGYTKKLALPNELTAYWRTRCLTMITAMTKHTRRFSGHR